MKYYVAAKLEDHERAQMIRDALNALGHEQTYDWTDHLEREKDADDAVYTGTAIDEVKGVLNADICIFIAPGGRGLHVELGVALAIHEVYRKTSRATRILFVGKGEGCVFYHHPAIEWINTFDVDAVVALATRR